MLENAHYATGPLATTDLHAGGIFFCVVYRERLHFQGAGEVRRWCEVIDDGRPFDDEATRLRATDMMGRYEVDGEKIVCRFPGLEMTGAICRRTPELLAFHVWRSGPAISASLVYRRLDS